MYFFHFIIIILLLFIIGKSSLLAAILGEINHDSSSGPFLSNFRGKHSLAYCSQRAWILAASVRANIAMAGQQDGMLSGNFKDPVNLNKDLYQTALESCRIVDDLKMWPDYDKTEIGERGISISGGQKARISLARAVYSDADCKYLRYSCFMSLHFTLLLLYFTSLHFVVL